MWVVCPDNNELRPYTTMVDLLCAFVYELNALYKSRDMWKQIS